MKWCPKCGYMLRSGLKHPWANFYYCDECGEQFMERTLPRVTLVYSLTSNTLVSESEFGMNKKQKRAYNRVVMGLKLHSSQGHPIWALTLYSPKLKARTGIQLRLRYVFRLFYMFYSRRMKARMEYVSLNKCIDGGELYVIGTGPIPPKWMSEEWRRLTSGGEVRELKIIWMRGFRSAPGWMEGVGLWLAQKSLKNFRQSRISWSVGWLVDLTSELWKRIRQAIPNCFSAFRLWRIATRFEFPFQNKPPPYTPLQYTSLLPPLRLTLDGLDRDRPNVKLP